MLRSKLQEFRQSLPGAPAPPPAATVASPIDRNLLAAQVRLAQAEIAAELYKIEAELTANDHARPVRKPS